LCTLPIVTIGLSITGLFYAVRRFAEGEYVQALYDFRRGITNNLKKGFISGLIFLLFIVVSLYGVYIGFYNGVILDNFIGKLFIIISLGILFCGYVLHIFVFTMIVRYDMPLKDIYRNSVGIIMLNMFKVLGIGFIPIAVSMILFIVPYSSILYFIMFFSLMSYIVVNSALNILVKYE
jgi:polyferredoxin